MNKLKHHIALVTDAFTTGGGLEHIRQIAGGMPDIQFGIFGKPGTGLTGFETIPNAEVFPDGYTPKRISGFQPDLIHFHHLKPLARYFANPFVRPICPVVFTAHGIHLHKYEFLQGLKHRIAGKLRSGLENYLQHRVDRVITVSRGDQNFLESSFNLKNTACIPNGLADKTVSPASPIARANIRVRYSVCPQVLLFLTVARFDFAKGHDILIQALGEIKQQLDPEKFQFLLVGDGPKLVEMKKLSAELGVERLVHFPGKIHPIDELLQAADVFILPSRWEGLPITLLEAGFHRLPVIASDTYGIREIIQDRETGWLFRNCDSADLAVKILQAAGSIASLRSSAENLHRLVSGQYSLRRTLEQLRKLYDQLILR